MWLGLAGASLLWLAGVAIFYLNRWLDRLREDRVIRQLPTAGKPRVVGSTTTLMWLPHLQETQGQEAALAGTQGAVTYHLTRSSDERPGEIRALLLNADAMPGRVQQAWLRSVFGGTEPGREVVEDGDGPVVEAEIEAAHLVDATYDRFFEPVRPPLSLFLRLAAVLCLLASGVWWLKVLWDADVVWWLEISLYLVVAGMNVVTCLLMERAVLGIWELTLPTAEAADLFVEGEEIRRAVTLPPADLEQEIRRARGPGLTPDELARVLDGLFPWALAHEEGQTYARTMNELLRPHGLETELPEWLTFDDPPATRGEAWLEFSKRLADLYAR